MLPVPQCPCVDTSVRLISCLWLKQKQGILNVIRSLSPQAFQPLFAQQRDLAGSDKGWTSIPIFGCLFICDTPPITKHLHSQCDAIPLNKTVWPITRIPHPTLLCLPTPREPSESLILSSKVGKTHTDFSGDSTTTG